MTLHPPDSPVSTLEPFGLGWPGKREALEVAASPARGRLVPDAAASLSLTDAPHRFYEGDNLEVLKLLAPELSGTVRMMYCDPPYNTGVAMRYPDNFRMGQSDYARVGGTEAASAHGGRRHAAWLSMMLPRLMACRALLADDGVIVVSIDDHEVHHLRMLMDEVFGAENFVATVTWRKKVVRGRGARHVLPQTEYLHVYAKRLAALPPFSEPLTDAMRSEYGERDARGPYKLIPLAKSGTSHSPRPNLVYPITAPDGREIPCPTHQWRWSQGTLAARMDEIVFKPNRKGGWTVYTKQYLQLEAGERERTPVSYYDRATTTDGTRELKRLFGRPVIDFPKPTRLIMDLLTWILPPGCPDPTWVLDAFAGSCPTAEAVLRLNAEDGGQRRFCCIQIAEPTNDDPEFATIAEIGRERIRRVVGEMEGLEGFEAFRLE